MCNVLETRRTVASRVKEANANAVEKARVAAVLAAVQAARTTALANATGKEAADRVKKKIANAKEAADRVKEKIGNAAKAALVAEDNFLEVALAKTVMETVRLGEPVVSLSPSYRFALEINVFSGAAFSCVVSTGFFLGIFWEN